jgi:hypothetical protein
MHCDSSAGRLEQTRSAQEVEMSSISRRIAALAHSRQGRQILDRLQHYAQKPENQHRIAQLRRRIARRHG